MTDTSYAYPAAPPVPAVAVDWRRHQRRSAVFWGAMLIVLGSAAFAAQFVPSVAWWMLWPLIVIVFGVAHMVSPDMRGVWTARRVFEGFGTVLVGGVLLGNTTGYVAWSAWLTFLSLWPVLLIALGISVIGRGVGAEWLRFAARLLVWATLALAVYVSLTGAALGFVSRSTVVTIPGVGVHGESVNITIESGGGVPSVRTW